MSNKTLYQIGEIAKKSGVTLRTLRYYEEIGLIEPSLRSDGNFRLYSSNVITKVKLINNLKKLDLSLVDVKKLFDDCDEDIYLKTKQILLTQKERVVNQINELESIKESIDESLYYVNECIICERQNECRNINCENKTHLIELPSA